MFLLFAIITVVLSLGTQRRQNCPAEGYRSFNNFRVVNPELAFDSFPLGENEGIYRCFVECSFRNLCFFFQISRSRLCVMFEGEFEESLLMEQPGVVVGVPCPACPQEGFVTHFNSIVPFNILILDSFGFRTDEKAEECNAACRLHPACHFFEVSGFFCVRFDREFDEEFLVEREGPFVGVPCTPSPLPTALPTEPPTALPTEPPTALPTEPPTEIPTEPPTEIPTEPPTEIPTEPPTEIPTEPPTEIPTEPPSEIPTEPPTEIPTEPPTEIPTEPPTEIPTEPPTEIPTEPPTELPTVLPSEIPTEEPIDCPEEGYFIYPNSIVPFLIPVIGFVNLEEGEDSDRCNAACNLHPNCFFEVSGPLCSLFGAEFNESVLVPSFATFVGVPCTRVGELTTEIPTEPPTEIPTEPPTEIPTEPPTEIPTEPPTEIPTEPPTEIPTEPPTEIPTEPPTEIPTEPPTEIPTEPPTELPTVLPSEIPTEEPIDCPEEGYFIYPNSIVPFLIPVIGFVNLEEGEDSDRCNAACNLHPNCFFEVSGPLCSLFGAAFDESILVTSFGAFVGVPCARAT